MPYSINFSKTPLSLPFALSPYLHSGKPWVCLWKDRSLKSDWGPIMGLGDIVAAFLLLEASYLL
jgi:hypothetical protein